MSEIILNKNEQEAFLEYVKAHFEIMQSVHVEEEKAASYYSIGSQDAYVPTQAPDVIEVETGPTKLMQTIKRLADSLLTSSNPDPFIIGMSVMGEERWTAKQRMAIWLMCTTTYRGKLEELGIDPSMIPSPAIENVKEKVVPIKEIYCDDRTMGFVIRFRYLPTNEFKYVRDGVSQIVGRQYHNGNAVGARLSEPHWLISGDAPSVKSLVKYIWQAFNGVGRIVPAEATDWHIHEGVAARMQWIMNRATTLRQMSAAHSSEWRPKLEYGSGVNSDGTPRKLYPYQMSGMEYALVQTEESRLSKGRYGDGVLIGDPMGLGKTAEAICSIVEAWEIELSNNSHLKREDLRCLIICPAAVKINWQREVALWVGRYGYTSQILRGNRVQPIFGNFVICNPSLIKKEYEQDTSQFNPSVLYTMILAQKWFGIIADESHQYKNERAQRTNNVLELFSGKRWNAQSGAMQHWRFPIPMRIMLSGSPVLNRPEEFASQLDALGILEQFGGRNRFENMYCVGRNRNRLVEMHERLMERGYLRREKEDMVLTADMRVIPLKNVSKNILNTTFTPREQWERVLALHEFEFLPGVLGQLPAKISTPVIVELSNRSEYVRAENNFLQWLREHYSDMEDVNQRVARAARNEALIKFNLLKHLAGRGKVKAFIDWTERFMEETDDQKLVVYIDHLDVYDELRAKFPNSRGIVGGQTEEVRQQNIDDFQNDSKVRLIICMLTAGGIGITLTAASHLVFLELGWTPAIHDQAEARIWGRVNDLHGASIYWFLADKTVDKQVSKLIDNKRDIVTASTQGAEVDESSLINEAAMSLLRERDEELLKKMQGNGKAESEEIDEE